jgi:hypothetical protein
VVCDRLVDSPTASAESKQLARSLLEGTFGKKKGQPGATNSGADSASDNADTAPAEAFDFAAHGSFMRA